MELILSVLYTLCLIVKFKFFQILPFVDLKTLKSLEWLWWKEWISFVMWNLIQLVWSFTGASISLLMETLWQHFQLMDLGKKIWLQWPKYKRFFSKTIFWWFCSSFSHKVIFSQIKLFLTILKRNVWVLVTVWRQQIWWRVFILIRQFYFGWLLGVVEKVLIVLVSVSDINMDYFFQT